MIGMANRDSSANFWNPSTISAESEDSTSTFSKRPLCGALNTHNLPTWKY